MICLEGTKAEIGGCSTNSSGNGELLVWTHARDPHAGGMNVRLERQAGASPRRASHTRQNSPDFILKTDSGGPEWGPSDLLEGHTGAEAQDHPGD